MKKIKRHPYNCPFCGSSPKIVKESDGSVYIHCSCEECVGYTCHLPKPTEQEAITDWNCRDEYL